MNLKKKIKRTLTVSLTKTAILCFNIIPRQFAILIGASIGLLAWKLLKKEQKNVFENLTTAYGTSLTDSQKYKIGKSFFINSGKNLIDVLRFKKYYHKQIKPLITIEGLEHFDKAYNKGKGVFGVTGHIGNFELLAVWIQNAGYDVAVIGREMYDKRMDKLLIDNRTSMGLTNIATTDSPKKIIKWLKDGKAIGVLIDNDSFRVRSMFIPAFGKPSNTPIGQSIIGLKTGAAFVPMACVRSGDNCYKIIIKPEVTIEQTDNFDDDVYNITLKCTQALEEIINDHKDQWIWIHNRWHTRPNV
ncbi:MAG: lysophospholipid acyltransferase family protein [candidate division Zixibacteria bacterium]|nr:lysophospholipid acyltransferase family protein [candidate division Zixibacteria bacterium]